MPETRTKTIKTKKRAAKRSAVAPAPKPRSRWWIYPAAGAVALYLAFQVYAPALHGPFVFDDTTLPYSVPNSSLAPWTSGARPLLMFSYWINYLWSKDPFYFHVLNVVFHVVNSFLVFLITRKLLAMSAAHTEPRLTEPRSGVPLRGGSGRMLAGFAAAVFLLHPIQTESVAYIAGRSEDLSVMFLLGAFAVFLYRRSAAATWTTAIGVLALGAAAAATKEHALVLPGLLLLTDYYWNPGFSFGGIRRNWRIYVPMALGGAAGLAFVARILSHAASAGFRLKDLTWYQYFFTECRAFFVYLRVLVFPFSQNLDYDFPISHSILEHGAIFGLAAIVLLAGAAIYFRRRYPLASYGFLVYLLLMAPTSSFVPIKDPLAERRMYLPMIGILLVVIALLQRIRLDRSNARKLAPALAAVVVLLAILTYQRNELWANDIALWEDTVHKSPGKSRAHFQLAHTYYANGRCQEAVAQYAETARLQPPDYGLLVDWGLAYDCAGQKDEAVAKLQQAAALDPSAHVYSQIAKVYAGRSRWGEALAALAQAEKLDPKYAVIYYYRGGIEASTNDFAAAVADYQRALTLGIDPALGPAVHQGLEYAEQRLRARTRR